MEKETKGLLLGVAGVVAFGLTLPATRYIIPYFDPVFIGLGRAVVASVFAGLILLVSRQPFPDKSQILQLVGVILGVVIGFPVFSAWAMKTVPASHGGVVLGILPLATAYAGTLVTHEKPSWGFWVCGIIGSISVIVFSLMQGAGSVGTGDLLLIASVVSAAMGYAFSGKLAKELGGWQVICWALVFAFPLILLPAWYNLPEGGFESLPVEVLLSFLYLAAVSQLFGFFLWNKGLALGGIARVSQTQLLQPFVTLLASAMLINEQITWQTLFFAVFVVMIVGIGRKMPVHQKSPVPVD